ncbi:MAG: hypothetical protein QF879_16200 [Candidatus Latescibacteria bacterium]|nr:hypothetical protein [Candidatus Latescibacterota bacterium]MDP7238789.1 hypothetical protein [Candidatus Latescibacterota bacterium]
MTDRNGRATRETRRLFTGSTTVTLREHPGGDGNEIDVWRRTLPVSHFDAVVCMVDPGKHDPEVKLLLGCSVEDKRIVCTFHETHGAGVILLERKAF